MKMASPQHRRSRTARQRGRTPARKVEQGKPPGTHETSGTLEQQADLAADQSLRRLTNISRGLTDAPPAAYDAPSSAGREIAAPVRLDLEETFGADLTVVRVHDDGAAHAAARREEAQAFTAGRDIYFAQGRYTPTSTAGRRLLSHEIAHVLQQTGKRVSATLIQATERTGSGDIQRAPAEPPFRASAGRYAPDLSRLRPADAAVEPAPEPPPASTSEGTDEEERHG